MKPSKGLSMTNKLTAKQENFARKYVECGNASEAYRTAYDVGEDTSPNGIRVDACNTLAKPNVALMVIELQEALGERTLVTAESLSLELDEAITLAKDTKQPAAITGAVMGKAKLHGLGLEKLALTDPTGNKPVNIVFTPVGNND